MDLGKLVCKISFLSTNNIESKDSKHFRIIIEYLLKSKTAWFSACFETFLKKKVSKP